MEDRVAESKDARGDVARPTDREYVRRRGESVSVSVAGRGREAIRRGDIRFRERGETVKSEGRGREGLRFMTT